MAKVNPIQLQKYLKGVSYPANKDSLLQAAKQNKADDTMYGMLEQLADKEYKTPADVSQEIGKHND